MWFYFLNIVCLTSLSFFLFSTSPLSGSIHSSVWNTWFDPVPFMTGVLQRSVGSSHSIVRFSLSFWSGLSLTLLQFSSKFFMLLFSSVHFNSVWFSLWFSVLFYLVRSLDLYSCKNPSGSPVGSNYSDSLSILSSSLSSIWFSSQFVWHATWFCQVHILVLSSVYFF